MRRPFCKAVSLLVLAALAAGVMAGSGGAVPELAPEGEPEHVAPCVPRAVARKRV
jgi:hypothetical protein